MGTYLCTVYSLKGDVLPIISRKLQVWYADGILSRVNGSDVKYWFQQMNEEPYILIFYIPGGVIYVESGRS